MYMYKRWSGLLYDLYDDGNVIESAQDESITSDCDVELQHEYSNILASIAEDNMWVGGKMQRRDQCAWSIVAFIRSTQPSGFV